MSAFRILVADDHPIFRFGLCSMLRSHEGWGVCGEAADGRDAVEKCKQIKPDLLILDICLPELNGLEAARQLHKLFPKMGILILSLHFSDQLVLEIVEAGARAYILKADADKDLVSAVEALANRRTFFTARAADMLLNGLSREKSIADPRALLRNRLTTREREIVQLLAEGKSSKEVAVALGISVKTAETHRANLMRKLEMHSVSEVVRYAVKNQIIEA